MSYSVIWKVSRVFFMQKGSVQTTLPLSIALELNTKLTLRMQQRDRGASLPKGTALNAWLAASQLTLYVNRLRFANIGHSLWIQSLMRLIASVVTILESPSFAKNVFGISTCKLQKRNISSLNLIVESPLFYDMVRRETEALVFFSCFQLFCLSLGQFSSKSTLVCQNRSPVSTYGWA